MGVVRPRAAFVVPVDCIFVFVGTCSDFAEKAAPHGSTANSSQIEGRAPEKGRKNHPKSE